MKNFITKAEYVHSSEFLFVVFVIFRKHIHVFIHTIGGFVG